MENNSNPDEDLIHGLFKALWAENPAPALRSGTVWKTAPENGVRPSSAGPGIVPEGEHRDDLRYGSQVEIAVQDVFHSSEEQKYPCINLSQKGFCIDCDSQWHAGALLAFRLELPNHDTVSGMAEVVWSHPAQEEGRHICGTKLLPLNPTQALKLIGYLKQLNTALLQ